MTNLTKTILITGASSGIGAELARQYASPATRLLLVGRNELRLNQVKNDCASRGAEVISKQLELSNCNEVNDWVHQQFLSAPIDLCILSAGTMQIEDVHDLEAQQKIFTVNTQSMFNVVVPLVPLLIQRGQGQIALLSSLRAFNSASQSPAYCASKAAIMLYGLGLRSQLQNYNVSVSVICPGYVDTPLTKGYRFKPLCMSVKRASKIIKKGIAEKKPLITFPFLIYFLSKILQILPVRFRQFLTRYL